MTAKIKLIFMRRWIEKINELQAWQVAIIFAAVGLAVFFTGLNGAFQGDDNYQIVGNPLIHSIGNLPHFFGASTFYNGQALSGVYYRPIMTAVFALVYSVFKLHPIGYHLVQLSAYVAGAFILYLLFKRFLKPVLALPLALIFLVHPLNSQVVYSIPTMQDALFFFFGVLGLWLLASYKTINMTLAASGCFLLSMLSKETGVVFVAMALVYLFWFEKARLKLFSQIIILPVALYLVLKVNAVGLLGSQHAAPIDSTGLSVRLLTSPSIILFYVSKFIFPWKLATGHYWVNAHLDFKHVILPGLIDLGVIGIFVYLGTRVRARLPNKSWKAYKFFALWTVVGLLPYLQIIKLDMTACETWFIFSMAGVLGMIGLAASSVKLKFDGNWLALPILALILLFGMRSAVRGLDYSSQFKLSTADLSVTQDNFSALNNISKYYIDHGQFQTAAAYAQRSINVYPVISNYNDLGVAREQLGDYKSAEDAYRQALKYGSLSSIYENLGLIYVVYSKPVDTNKFFVNALNQFPHDYKLWVYYAIFNGAAGNTSTAKTAIQAAAQYGQVPQAIYQGIINEQPFVLQLLGKTLIVK